MPAASKPSAMGVRLALGCRRAGRAAGASAVCGAAANPAISVSTLLVEGGGVMAEA
jgi:hypothetical protein